MNQLYTVEVGEEMAAWMREGTLIMEETESIDGQHRLGAVRYIELEDGVVVEVGWGRPEDAIEVSRNQSTLIR